ncbi:AF4/FMR2 family member 2 [Salmo salar]|uniref:AF4/FMR2 family member 2 n=1 Tax=Salmo salar TaxID=8030 RepID=A0A1S3SUY6_SALSA|nr:AF4/FMR2 family member 2-like [Salmo salar]|eukprot:XP_014068153.1 PREDICTED: AF4/FMR2 family member 2-like [Salmo salar]
MDLFEFDFFRDWELEQQCHYEQDRNALKKREWERRTQEVQQDEDLFSSGFNLFGEPYKTEAPSLSTLGGTNNLNKTNKGDALANRVQNTLGNYDEMKELLTSHSNQSHLVGIPKNFVPQTPGPMEKQDQPSFLTKGGQRGSNRVGTGNHTTSMPPPPSSSSLTSSSLLHGHQSSKKSWSSDWSRGAHCSTQGVGGQGVGGQGVHGVGGLGVQGVGGPSCSRGKHSFTHEQQQQPQRHEELLISQGEVVDHRGDSSSSPSSSSTSTLSRRHGGGQQQAAKAPSAAEHGSYKDSNTHVKSPLEQEPGSHGASSPVASTSLLPSGLSTPTFPQGLHVKPSAVQQQKPTAYVRPMDGQDQMPLDSPELKPPLEVVDVGYSNPAFGSTITSSKSKLPKLTLTQTGEVGLSSDSSCVEEILREMTHSWPPPLTAIHTPGKAEQTRFPIPSKESQHIPSGCAGQKRCNVPVNKPATKSVPQKSMLEDDLKISSDEEDTEQQGAEKPKPRSTPLSIPVATSRTSDPGHSSGASASSSESESSSESDSDSESSSSDSECNRASRTATPEPEPPSTNKWQLDKWLNKVTPHNKALISTQPERESHGLCSSQPDHSQQAPGSQDLVPGKSKPGPTVLLAQTDAKERALLSPIREKAKPKTGPKVSEGKSSKSPAAVVEPAPARRSIGKKQPKKVECSSSLEEHSSWSKPINPSISTTPKEKEPPPLLEPPKSRTKGTSGKAAPRKEPRTTTITTSTPAHPPPAPVLDKKKHRGPSKILPKSKEFIETESSSSECHSEPEDLIKVPNPPCPGPSSLQTLKAAKDCNSNILSVSSLTSTCSTSISIPDSGVVGGLMEDPLLSPVPIIQNELLSPLRDFEDIKSLWVKIELSFLSRIPGQDPPEPPPVKVEPQEHWEPSTKHRRQSPASQQSTPVEKPPSKAKRKHKSDHCNAVGGSKKLRLEKDSMLLPPCISPIHNHKNISTKDSLRKQPRKRELLPPLLSPLSDEPPVRQRRTSECSSFSQEGSASGALLLPTLSCSLPPFSSSSSSSSSHKHLSKGESKFFSHSKTSSEEDTHSKPSGSFHGNGQSDSDLWSNPSSLSMDHMEPRRPKLTFNNKVHTADYYMQEAKKLKHKADALMEKYGKAVNYADGALSFIECGNAMERDPLEAKSPYTMYSETVELIRYAMRLKNFTSHSATVAEKKLAVLCNRCLSLLYLRMFKLKKDHAVKYSRSLMEYFKNSAKSSQVPSPWGANGKNTGTPSPLSLSLSPVSWGSSSTGHAGSGASGNVAIPQRIHQMAASHINITNNILRSYEHWDTAEKLATESQEFFQELDSMMEPLSQHSSMIELVRYIRQGLHWLRIEAHLL